MRAVPQGDFFFSKARVGGETPWTGKIVCFFGKMKKIKKKISTYKKNKRRVIIFQEKNSGLYLENWKTEKRKFDRNLTCKGLFSDKFHILLKLKSNSLLTFFLLSLCGILDKKHLSKLTNTSGL